jgi:hypothetical protein
MKRVRLSLSLVLLAAVLSTGYFQSADAQEPTEGGRCNCMTPNTGKYGVKQPTDNTCPETNCYIDLLP